MDASAPSGYEFKEAFKKRLRRTALSTSKITVRNMVAKMRSKAKEIYDADGKDIASD